MNSRKTLTPTDDLKAQLQQIGLAWTAQQFDDLVSRATTQRWSPRQLLEEIARSETADLARRSLERRLASISTVLETTNIWGDKQGVRQNREPGACHRTRAWAWGIGSARRLQDTGCEPVCRA